VYLESKNEQQRKATRTECWGQRNTNVGEHKTERTLGTNWPQSEAPRLQGGASTRLAREGFQCERTKFSSLEIATLKRESESVRIVINRTNLRS
jgi:hypothetical protein